MLSEKDYGFLYSITRLSDSRKYIGMKSFTVKDWPYYKSSSKALVEEIKAFGGDYLQHYRFDLLCTCPNKSGLRSAEIELQFLLDVIHDDQYINTHIGNMRWLQNNKGSKIVKERVYKLLGS